MLLQFSTIRQRSAISLANIPEELASWLCDPCSHTGAHTQKVPMFGLVLYYCFLEVLKSFSTRALHFRFFHFFFFTRSYKLWSLSCLGCNVSRSYNPEFIQNNQVFSSYFSDFCCLTILVCTALIIRNRILLIKGRINVRNQSSDLRRPLLSGADPALAQP